MIRDRRPAFVAAFIGLLWYLELGGGHTLNPVNLDWVLDGDWRQHLLGWLFFRNEPWTFPLGTITSLPYGIGTTIGFTDSNPLISLLLKPFSPWLPADFQFIGPWLASCFVLQGYMGAKLARLVTKDPLQQVLGGCLFVFSPILAARMGHDTLCAHWILLGLMYTGLREYRDGLDARRTSWWSVAAVMTAAAIHPYLAAMTFVLAMAGFIRFWLTALMTRWRALVSALAATAGLLLVWYVIGYFGRSTASSGFGEYSADIVTLFDPREYSGLVPSFGLASARWEGFGFLGLGGIFAAAVAAIAARQQHTRLSSIVKPVMIACVLMALYALSSDIRFDGTLILRIRKLYDYIKPVTGAFRASGRFIWPLHYLVLLAGLWGLTRLTVRNRQSMATALLTLAVMLQAVDLRVLPVGTNKHFRQAPDGGLQLARGHFRHMAVYPMQILGGCGETYEEDHVYRWMLEAYRLDLTYNSGIFARFSWDAAQLACTRLKLAVEDGRLDPTTIYVVAKDQLPWFARAEAACGRFDGDWLCVSKDSNERFRTLVTTGK
jgi:hypothetical protein